MAPLLPPSARPYMANTAAVISLIPIMAGINAVLRPQAGLEMLGFAAPTGPKEKRLAHGLVQMYGCRQLATGMAGVAMWYCSSYKAMGWSLICGSIVALVDGLATKSVMGDGEWKHWGALPVGLGLGLGLIEAI